jgi:hypothetical protein
MPRSDHEPVLERLKNRFESNMQRHPDCEWAMVLDRLKRSPKKLAILAEMDATGGEPDVVSWVPTPTQKPAASREPMVLVDCSAESPTGRRSLCYDLAAWTARKTNRPASNACDMAAQIGIELLTEEEYRHLQTFGAFDLKTSSWVETPFAIRELGGALFCDRRYDSVFTYHNGADSYFAARGFRGKVEI